MARITVTSCLAVSLAFASTGPAAADAITDWNARAGDAALAACISPANDPLHESRMYAMMHIATHDALNAIVRRSRAYAFRTPVVPGASPDAAVAAAARDVLVAAIAALPFPPDCVSAGLARVEADYITALAAIPDGAAKAQGIMLGRASAAAILAARANDGSDTPLVETEFVQGTAPGEYRFTPDFDFVFAPGWGDVKPFVLADGSHFRPNAPYKVTSKRYAADFDEVKKLGGDGATTLSERTPDQTQIGLFWLESSPLAWNRIARAVSASQRLGLWENARLFGLLNMALADAYVGSWEAKYHYAFWRPVTAIRNADSDENPWTEVDPGWTPLQLTYPMPDHDSAHAAQGGAAAEVLKQFFGTDNIPFSACSRTLPAGSRCIDGTPTVRTYPSFSAAADENGWSRILVGIHFRHAVEEGIEHGRKIGRHAVSRFMKPAK